MLKYYITSNKYSVKERQTKGGKVYDVVFRVHTIDGTVKQKNLCGYRTRSAAKQGYLDFVRDECEIVNKSAIAAKKEANAGRNELTVREYAEIYLASLRNQNKESSIFYKRQMFDAAILPMIGDEHPSDLTVERLYRWQDDLWAAINPRNGAHYSYTYLCNIRRITGILLQWISDRYGIPNNLPSVRKPRSTEQKKEMQIWSRDEFEQFLSVVDDPMYRAMFAMMFFTGRRKSEIFALGADDVRGSDIIFNKAHTRKTADRTPYKITAVKNRKTGITPICKPLADILSEFQPKKPFYFCGEKPPVEVTVARKFNYYTEKAGVKRIRLHDLRHSFASMLIHNGVNLLVVADLLGDNPEQIMRTYGHLYISDIYKAMDSII